MINAALMSNVYVIRGGDNFEKYGDPYTFSMVIGVDEKKENAVIEAFCRNQDGTELGKNTG